MKRTAVVAAAVLGASLLALVACTPRAQRIQGQPKPAEEAAEKKAAETTTPGVHTDRDFTERLPPSDEFQDGFGLPRGVMGSGNVRVHGGGSTADAAAAPPAPSLAYDQTSEVRQPSGPFQTEEYDRIEDNPFRLVRVHPVSTFSIDVDTASYSNVRRFLTDGQLPPADAVRLEEMVNYFDYDYPQPEGDRPFSISTEISLCPWNREHRLVHLGLQGRSVAKADMPDSNLVFLIDVSGSMQPPDKLPLLKEGFKAMTRDLAAHDRVAIVVYAGSSGLVLPSTPGDRKEAILAALDALTAGGSTAGAAGIELAYRVAQENFIAGGNNRVILATDGDFNVGVSSTSELERLIEEKRASGIFLTVLGFGTGNTKDSRMETLADKGNGNYAYIDTDREARRVLVEDRCATMLAIAKDVKIQVEFNPAKVCAYRLLGYENRLLAREDFNDDRKDAGEIGAGHTVTALYEIVPADGEIDVPPVDDLRYQDSGVRPEARALQEILFLRLRYKAPAADESQLIEQALTDEHVPLARCSDDFLWSAAVAEFALLLRGAEERGDASFAQALELARGAVGADPGGYRAEFLQLVETAANLSQGRAVTAAETVAE